MESKNNRVIHDAHATPDTLDMEKLRNVFLKSIPFIIIIILLSLFIAATAIRYTKEMFKSSSILQLDIKSEAKVLGFKSFDDDINNLAREIEIIKSKLFLSKVAESLNYEISYYQYGDILYEERYTNAPFHVKVLDLDHGLYDHPIDVEISNSKTFTLHYELGNKNLNNIFHFGDTLNTGNLKVIITKTDNYVEEADNRYFFVINTHNSLVNYLDQNLTVEPLDFKAKTISISFRDHNKYKVHDLVNAIDTMYIYYTQQEKNKTNNQKISFLNEQLSQTEERLNDLENYFENFTIHNKTTDLDANISNTILMLDQLDSQRFYVQQKLKWLNEAQKYILDDDQVDVGLINSSISNGSIRANLQELNTLYQNRALLLSSYNKNTLAYKKLNKEIELMREQLINTVSFEKKKQIDALEELKSRRAKLESQFVGLPSKQTEYSKTERYYQLYEEFYLTLMKNKAEFELAQAGTVTNYRILSPASSPSKPISPNKMIYYGIGGILGLFISFLFIGFRYLLHNKITSQREIERHSSAFVIGAIPYYLKEKNTESRLVVHQNLKSAISESFRSIRANLEFINQANAVPIIAITSTVSGEGKTFISANLGGIISLLNQRVILLDLDMRKPRFHEVFNNQKNEKGLSTILIKKHNLEECITHTELDNLDYIPAGPVPPNPSELILGGVFEELIQELKGKYDVIIIDTPPVGLVTDGIHALRIATIPIYVLRSDFSKKTFLKNIDRLISVHKLKNLSIIFNSVKSSNTYGYGKGYYEENATKRKKIKQLFQF